MAHPAPTEIRVTPWVDVSAKPEWAESGMAAYRIWQRADQFGWTQRHEWRFTNGGTRMESWIRGMTHFMPHAVPVEGEV
ncbi:MAG TPA: hypothetical protein VIJ94_09340 [Caulobacteraceae bacterium]